MAVPRIATPAQGMWTWEHLQALPDDGVRREIIGRELLEMSGPTPAHAKAVRNLLLLLAPCFRALGMTVFTTPLDVVLRDAAPVQPDLFALRRGGEWARSEPGIEGAPEFVVEVISLSTRGRGQPARRALYQQAGVREYRLVDVDNHSVDVLALDGETLVAFSRADGDDAVRSRLFADLSFPAAAVFRGDA